jgi:hypothetical protein
VRGYKAGIRIIVGLREGEIEGETARDRDSERDREVDQSQWRRDPSEVGIP